MLYSFAFLASVIASAAAHATFQELWINGVDQGNYCVRLPQSNSPVQSVSTDDIACNANATPSNGICSVNPGDTVTVEMHQQPNDRSCSTEAIGGDHWGPVLVYMAQVDNALTAVGYEQNWFKVSEIGLPSNNPEYWGTEVLNDNCGHYTFTVPAGIAPGNYLIRAEVIALHVASSVGGAQFYMSCYQVNVGGSGTANPPTVKFPGAYGASDPGILIDIYESPKAYTIPGPTPYGTTSPTVATTPWPTTATWNTALQPSTVPTTPPAGAPTGPSGGSSTTTTTSTTTTPTTTSKSSTTTSKSSSTTSKSTTTTTSTTTSSSPTGSPVPQYGQCGGIGWTGSTTCASGFTCTQLNSYYFQCL